MYLDATIPSYAVDSREQIKLHCGITRQWWRNERGNYRLFVSDETLAELGEGTYQGKQAALAMTALIPVLRHTDRITEIAAKYIEHRLMPRVLGGDAFHLAYASFYGIDFLLTWNCNHLANANKRQHIRWLNTSMDLGVPEIVTPLELVKEKKI